MLGCAARLGNLGVSTTPVKETWFGLPSIIGVAIGVHSHRMIGGDNPVIRTGSEPARVRTSQGKRFCAEGYTR
jgi:hypothetical protein